VRASHYDTLHRNETETEADSTYDHLRRSSDMQDFVLSSDSYAPHVLLIASPTFTPSNGSYSHLQPMDSLQQYDESGATEEPSSSQPWDFSQAELVDVRPYENVFNASGYENAPASGLPTDMRTNVNSVEPEFAFGFFDVEPDNQPAISMHGELHLLPGDSYQENTSAARAYEVILASETKHPYDTQHFAPSSSAPIGGSTSSIASQPAGYETIDPSETRNPLTDITYAELTGQRDADYDQIFGGAAAYADAFQLFNLP
jgi:hypothetical protein